MGPSGKSAPHAAGEPLERRAPKCCRVHIPLDGVALEGILTIPEHAKGLVIFVHGSGSSRNSPRNRYVAGVLNEHGTASLLVDLLTEEEGVVDDQTRHLRFDIPLLSARLGRIIDWAGKNPATSGLSIGLFGASTGAAAALIAATRYAGAVKAVVSRGGRPDLAMESLPFVAVPVLLIVGAADPEVLRLNGQALEKLGRRSAINIIPRATHLFEEPGALEDVARRAAAWFERYLT